MELSCKSEYAILALLELAAHYSGGEPLQIRQIAAQQHIPDRYLEQLLATIRRAGLIRSQRGAKGGYELAREPWKISLLEVINCLEGSTQQSTERLEKRTLETLIVGEIWQESRQAAEGILQKYTLQDLVEKRDYLRRSDNIMYYI